MAEEKEVEKTADAVASFPSATKASHSHFIILPQNTATVAFPPEFRSAYF